MKKLISLLLILSLILCGCGGKTPAETTAPATEAPTTVPVTEEPTEAPTTVPPTEEPTEAPTEAPTEPPVPTNPLTGEKLEAPMTSRNFAVVINNVPGAMPMHGVSKADLFFEMFVNDYATRGLAIFSDLTKVKSIGSVRSLRYNFIDLAQVYDAVVVHVGASDQVMGDLSRSGVNNVNVGYGGSGYYYRDQERLNAGYATEHTMMVWGAETVAYAGSREIRIDRPEDADYGLRFIEDGTPAEGETANVITIHMIHGHADKQSVMKYNPDLGKYLFHQYGYAVYDSSEKQNVCFENVIVMFCEVTNQGVYHVADLLGSGEGFFACGGKIIPIQWNHDSETDAITFTLADGTPLELGVGSTYVAIAPLDSRVDFE